jgi:hypothetical protein
VGEDLATDGCVPGVLGGPGTLLPAIPAVSGVDARD